MRVASRKYLDFQYRVVRGHNDSLLTGVTSKLSRTELEELIHNITSKFRDGLEVNLDKWEMRTVGTFTHVNRGSFGPG